MKKLFIFLTISVANVILFTHSADAHVLVTDKNIGAVLHIDPDDDPIAGQQSSFFFEFRDIQNKFSPEKCTCMFSIVENGNSIYTQPLFQNNTNPSLTDASVFYTFPKRDVYQVRVVGKPTMPNDFQPFTLSYDIRVERTSEQSTAQPTNTANLHLSHYVAGGVIIILFSTFLITNYLQSKKKLMKGGEKKDDKKN